MVPSLSGIVEGRNLTFMDAILDDLRFTVVFFVAKLHQWSLLCPLFRLEGLDMTRGGRTNRASLP